MKCTAGKNYFLIHHDGTVYRCSRDRELHLPSIGHIQDLSFLEQDFQECSNIEECRKIYLGDWNRTCRFQDIDAIDASFQGDCVSDPKNTFFSKLCVTSRCNYRCFYCTPERIHSSKQEELPLNVWKNFIDEIGNKGFSRIQHHIQGTVGEPLLYDGIDELVSYIQEKGQEVCFISNLSINHDRLNIILEKSDRKLMYFGASLHLTEKNFNWELFRDTVLKIKEKGFYIEILYVGIPSQFYLYQYVNDFFQKYDIPTRLLHVSCLETTPKMEEDFKILLGSSKNQTTVYAEKKSSFLNIGTARLDEIPEKNYLGVLEHAINSGMKFIDVGSNYGEDRAEKFLNPELRKSVLVSAKWSPYIHNKYDNDDSSEYTLKMVQRVLTKLKVDYLDYYLVWSIMNKDQLWKIQRPGGMIEGLLKAKEQGLVRHIGVSVHCDPEDFREWALQAKYCELAVFPVNLVNSRYLQCLEKVHQMGTKTLVMNPLCGGKLPSEDERIVELLKKTSINSIPELSIRYLKTNKNIDGILLGIKSKEDIDSAFSHLAKPDLTEQDLNAIKEFQNSYSKVKLCTKCKYCLPCPNGIDIPEVLEFLRIYRDWKKEIPDDIKRWTEKSGIKNCSQCKACESSCPSKIKVSSLIQKFLDGTSFKSLK